MFKSMIRLVSGVTSEKYGKKLGEDIRKFSRD